MKIKINMMNLKDKKPLFINLILALCALFVLLFLLLLISERKQATTKVPQISDPAFLTANKPRMDSYGINTGKLVISDAVSDKAVAYNSDSSLVKYFRDNTNSISDMVFVGNKSRFAGNATIIQTNICLDVDYIPQLPELPSGSEITSLSMLLKYYGYDVDKCMIADRLFEYGEAGVDSMYEKFIGSPYDNGSYGCYAPVVAEAANKVLEMQGSTLHAYDKSGMTQDELIKCIKKSKPVIVWSNADMKESGTSKTWKINGKKVVWKSAKNCVVLIGFDSDKKEFTVIDPLKGTLTYSMSDFMRCYNDQFSQAVVIE